MDSRQFLTQSPVSVGFISLGCAKNLVDSQIMAGVLVKEGMRLAASPEEADVVLVNTCAFIEEAREESLDAIRAACRLKTDGTCRAILVAGCYPQRYRDRLREQLPDVDAFIGVDELERVGAVVRDLIAGARGGIEVSATPGRLFEPPVPGLVFSNGCYAYLKIAEGCNHPCAFCAIPAIRGNYRSRSIERVVREAEQLLGEGFRELDLISQDVTAYGHDRRDGTDLPALLRALGRIGGRFWIRLLYGYPSGVTDRLIAAIAEVPQVCRYLDVPVQHSHPEMLRAMRRAGTADTVRDLAVRWRRLVPGLVLRTTCLVGFPGETDGHFDHLLNYVREAEFDHLGVFVFSPEEGTTAFDMASRPPQETAERRRERLLLAQKEIVDRKLAALVGSEGEVILDRRGPESGARRWLARSARQAPEVDGVVRVRSAPDAARAGDFVRVRYTSALDYDMNAAAVKPEKSGA